jgi:hypothetical protein
MHRINKAELLLELQAVNVVYVVGVAVQLIWLLDAKLCPCHVMNESSRRCELANDNSKPLGSAFNSNVDKACAGVVY